jgi:hypothetical protein
MTRSTAETRPGVAYEEAAHVVAAVVEGCPFQFVTIIANDDAAGLVRLLVDDTMWERLHYGEDRVLDAPARISLAGRIAQARHDGCKPEWEPARTTTRPSRTSP